MTHIPPHIPVPPERDNCQLVDPCRTDKYYEDETDEDE